MTKAEIALQLTLSAIEHKLIFPDQAHTTDEINALNAKRISDFYNKILSELSDDLSEQQ